MKLELAWDAPASDVSAPALETVTLSIRKFPKISHPCAFHPSTHSTTRRMAQRASVKTTYEVDRTLQPIYSGGSLALSQDGRILAASIGEDVLLTDLTNGNELGRVEGDGEAITALTCSVYTFTLRNPSLTAGSNTVRVASHSMLTISVHAHICSESLRHRRRHN